MKRTRRDLCWLAGPVALCCSINLVGLGCNHSRPVPPDPGGLPPSSAGQHAPDDPARLTHAPESQAAQQMPPGHPPVLTPAQPAEAAPALPDLSKNVSGKLVLSDKVKAKVSPGATVFLVARGYQQGGPGPVLAVKKLTVDSWPIPFELSSADVMLEGSTLSGKVVVTARVDQDGDAMTKQPGDVEGMSKPVEVPAKNVELLLDTIRTEAAGPPPQHP